MNRQLEKAIVYNAYLLATLISLWLVWLLIGEYIPYWVSRGLAVGLIVALYKKPHILFAVWGNMTGRNQD